MLILKSFFNCFGHMKEQSENVFTNFAFSPFYSFNMSKLRWNVRNQNKTKMKLRRPKKDSLCFYGLIYCSELKLMP